MTQIISCQVQNQCFQLGDRRLTKRTNVWDESSNKQLGYCMPRGTMALGYSGAAFLNNTHTDRWIAEQLCGFDLPPGSDLKIEMRPQDMRNVGHIVKVVTDSLNDIWPTQPDRTRKLGLSVSIVGWDYQERQRKQLPPVRSLTKDNRVMVRISHRGRWRPFIRSISWNAPNRAFVSEIRNDLSESESTCNHVGVSLGNQQSLLSDLSSTLVMPTGDAAERAILKCIQNSATSTDLIGKNFLAIRISGGPPANRVIQIRSYLQNPSYRSRGTRRPGFLVMQPREDLTPPDAPPSLDGLEVCYTPWIILPDLVMPPSAAVGDFAVGRAGTQVRIIGPHADSDILAGFVAQERKPEY